jgi:uncharacterized lipoprotein YddW (UPF0748 family)
MPEKRSNQGSGCAQIPLLPLLLLLGGGYWWAIHQGNLQAAISRFFPKDRQNVKVENVKPERGSVATKPAKTAPKTPSPSATNISSTPPTPKPAKVPTAWETKAIRGIYLSRYSITNNTDEQTIRNRVRYYRDRGINTIIHGVWGNGCTMYQSEVTNKLLNQKSCPNQFHNKWLDWTIDEAHKNGMQVHAYFEKGIKLDKNSPIFDLATEKKWIVPGVDKTYSEIDHYVLDVEVPEVAELFEQVMVEFAHKYPKINAIQWDDYLGYHAELPGKIDRTEHLTKFLGRVITSVKDVNPLLSFDLCHHNPYWAKRYFAADWQKWKIDRAFIQAYSEKNFNDELNYARKYAGVAITDRQFHRLDALTKDPKIKSILVFSLSGKPEETADKLSKIVN